MSKWAAMSIPTKIAVGITATTVTATTAYIIWQETVKLAQEKVVEIATNTDFSLTVETPHEGFYNLGYKEKTEEEETEATTDNAGEDTAQTEKKYSTSDEVIDKIAEKLQEEGISAKSLNLDKDSGYIQKFINAEIVTNYPNLAHKYEEKDYKFKLSLDEINTMLKNYGIEYDTKGTNEWKLQEGVEAIEMNNSIADTQKWKYKDHEYSITIDGDGNIFTGNHFIKEFKRDGVDILPREIAKKTLQGTVNIIRRTPDFDEETKELLGEKDLLDNEAGRERYLEYIPYGDEDTKDTFLYLLKKNDKNILKYFSINEENWDIYVATYKIENGGEPTFSAQTISYKNIISKYSVPFEFLVALSDITSNPEWAAKIAEMVSLNSRTDFIVQDCLKYEHKVVEEKHEKEIKDKEGFVLRTETWYETIEDTTTLTNTITAYVREVDTWIVNVKQNYIKKSQGPTTSSSENGNIKTTTTTASITYQESTTTTNDNGTSLGAIDEEVQTILEDVKQTWPENMEEGRKELIEKAASLVNKGCKYSQELKDPKSAKPSYLDCASYVSWAFTQTGHTDVKQDSYTGDFVSSEVFTAIDESELVPGDVGLNNATMASGNDNHIGIYIGKDSSGQNIWLHCTSSGINGPQTKTGNGNFSVFYRYTNW